MEQLERYNSDYIIKLQDTYQTDEDLLEKLRFLKDKCNQEGILFKDLLEWDSEVKQSLAALRSINLKDLLEKSHTLVEPFKQYQSDVNKKKASFITMVTLGKDKKK